MKKNLLFLLIVLVGMGSLFAFSDTEGNSNNGVQVTRLEYRFEKHQIKKEVSVEMAVGSQLCIEGDENNEVVGASQMTKIGRCQREADHIVMYQGGLGGKEGIKHTYNVSLWRFDEDAYNDSIEDNDSAPLSILQKNIHNRYGYWKFRAVAPTSPDKPQTLLFVNRDGVTVTFSVTVIEAGVGSLDSVCSK